LEATLEMVGAEQVPHPMELLQECWGKPQIQVVEVEPLGVVALAAAEVGGQVEVAEDLAVGSSSSLVEELPVEVLHLHPCYNDNCSCMADQVDSHRPLQSLIEILLWLVASHSSGQESPMLHWHYSSGERASMLLASTM